MNYIVMVHIKQKASWLLRVDIVVKREPLYYVLTIMYWISVLWKFLVFCAGSSGLLKNKCEIYVK